MSLDKHAWPFVAVVCAGIVSLGLYLGLRDRGPESSPTAPSVQQQESSSQTDDTDEITVYVTRTGTKYHRAGCRYLSKSKIPMPLSRARRRYSPCSVCNPPR